MKKFVILITMLISLTSFAELVPCGYSPSSEFWSTEKHIVDCHSKNSIAIDELRGAARNLHVVRVTKKLKVIWYDSLSGYIWSLPSDKKYTYGEAIGKKFEDIPELEEVGCPSNSTSEDDFKGGLEVFWKLPTSSEFETTYESLLDVILRSNHIKEIPWIWINTPLRSHVVCPTPFRYDCYTYHAGHVLAAERPFQNSKRFYSRGFGYPISNKFSIFCTYDVGKGLGPKN